MGAGGWGGGEHAKYTGGQKGSTMLLSRLYFNCVVSCFELYGIVFCTLTVLYRVLNFNCVASCFVL